jgi:hypothetical protein
MQCSICDPATIILISNFSYSLFSNPTHKTKIGTANRWDTTNNKPAGRLLLMVSQKEGPAVRSYLLHSSLAGVRVCGALYQSQQMYKNVGPNPFCLAKWAYFDFSSLNITGSHTEHQWSCA